MAGSILANLSVGRPAKSDKKVPWSSLSWAGVTIIFVSLFVLNEGPQFPGYRAIFPVLGTVLFLGSTGRVTSWPERLLSTGPMVFIGRMSYSLYLWHWPIFSFVDYTLYLASPLVRMGLKVALTAAAAAVCFFFIETPGRVFFNHPCRRRLAFAFLACALVICVPLGTAVRRTNYIDARAQDIADGGIVFNRSSELGSIVVMGDSNGSMYGKMAKEIAQGLGRKLHVISVAAGDPLPHSSGPSPQLWLDSLEFVKRENPDVVLLICNWESKLKGERSRLEFAVNELRQHTRRLILITQPPELPKSADRESMRNGSRPPFREDPIERAERTESNAFLKSFQRDNVIVVDIEPLFATSDGRIRFANDAGNLLFHGTNHLSDVGADLVKADVIRAISE